MRNLEWFYIQMWKKNKKEYLDKIKKEKEDLKKE